MLTFDTALIVLAGIALFAACAPMRGRDKRKSTEPRAKSGHFVLLRTHFAIPSEQLRRCAHDVMVITKMRFLLIGRK